MRAAALVLLLAGCQSLPDAPREVLVPVAIACLNAADLPARPAFAADADLAKMSDAALILALRANDLERQRYLPQVDALLVGCAK